MYERSAIVLERYYNNLFGLDKKINLKNIYEEYKELVEKIEKYQIILEQEENIINEFDELANEIRKIQKAQKRIYEENTNYEIERNKLFSTLDNDSEIIEVSLKNIEEQINKNNKELEELRADFIKYLTEFSEKQKERNKSSRSKRTEEKNYLEIIEKCNSNINEISESVLKNIKEFKNLQDENSINEIKEIMINNGKNERIPFDKNVIEIAINIRNEIAKKEAECYLTSYDKMKKLLIEINSDEIKLDKYKKTLRDTSVKIAFLEAQKMYIVSFLDYERMSAINGRKIHKQLMEETCKNIELDMAQFNNLYELILKETSGKSSKKAYKELYNKEYLKNIEEKEKTIEEEINNMKIKTGTIINSNYWRIEEIKNIYEVFQKEITEKFGKDLSEFKLEETEQETQTENKNKQEITEEDNEIKEKIDIFDIPEETEDDIEEYYDEDEDYNEQDDENEDEYEDDDEDYYDDDEYDEDDDEDYYDDDEYDDEDEYEDDDEDYYDDDEYDEDDDEDCYDDDEEKNEKQKGFFNKFLKK